MKLSWTACHFIGLLILALNLPASSSYISSDTKGDVNFRWKKRPNHSANMTLLEACSFGARNYPNEKFTEVKEALMRGADPNYTGNGKLTPLMQEASWGHVRTALLLLRYGASVNPADGSGNTALIYASSRPYRNDELVKALLKHGAIINYRNKTGRDALYYARKNDNLTIVSILLGHLHKHNGRVKGYRR